MRWRGTAVKLERGGHPVSRAGLAVLVVVLWLAPGCRTAPLEHVIRSPIPAQWTGVPVEDRDEAVWRAGRKVGWQIEILEPGTLRGTWRRFRHAAVASITHDAEMISVEFQRSENLQESSDDRIHRSYRVVVQQLLDQIAIEPVR